MRITGSQQRFLSSDEGAIAKKELQRMAGDEKYNTLSTYDSTTQKDLSFTDRHMKYLSEHIGVKPMQYISNLRLMTKIKKR